MPTAPLPTSSASWRRGVESMPTAPLPASSASWRRGVELKFLRRLLVFLPIILLPLFLRASYEFTPQCQQAMHEMYCLRTNTARNILKTERAQNPGNHYAIFLEHYCDVMDLVILDDEKKYNNLFAKFEERRKIMDEDHPTSPYYRMIEAEMLLHMGLAQIKYGTKVNGVSKIISSYKIIEENQKIFSSFVYDDKLSGVYSVVLGNVPPRFNWALKMLGMRGNIDKGFTQLKSYYDKVKQVPGYSEEIVLLINFAYKYTWKEQEGFQFLGGLPESMFESPLVSYFYANQAYFAYQNELALGVLQKIDRHKSELSFISIDYQLGKCKLNRLDSDADIYLIKFLQSGPGKDYKKETCNRLSWHYLVHGDMQNYQKYKEMVSYVGSDLRDRDIEAISESNLDYTPNVSLLKARLLFDGGYFDLAMQEINKLTESSLHLLPYKIEYHYRKGRIYHKTQNYGQAISEYFTTLSLGRDEDYSFATRAAFSLGEIYEIQGNFAKAEQYYQLCKDLYDSNHTEEGLLAKAERGLERVRRED